ncbi:UNVERIFIED_ORG: FAD-dependent sensor of blue light [Zoogloea ramigera]|uniref:BLUF domain-containing protein n=1 Tax=Duganella zoogloeoides TaxID=75659 RepID=A0ABZ0Y4F4_9BURK|nr:BLUF domain-containing protein [Duganella zoogloeoides]WQH06946.1 BLUF domain-containing protein [Duganella zoogloeoides]
MLVRLLYASHAARDTPVGGITAIMQQSHNYNPRHGITGVLCHSDRLYLQVIEGGREQVNALYAKILRDPRHTDAILLHYEEICERRYSGWTMGQVNLNKLNPGTLLRYSALPEFNPHALSGKSSLALIDELMAAASILGRA